MVVVVSTHAIPIACNHYAILCSKSTANSRLFFPTLYIYMGRLILTIVVIPNIKLNINYTMNLNVRQSVLLLMDDVVYVMGSKAQMHTSHKLSIGSK